MRFGKLNRDPDFKPLDVRCTKCHGLGYLHGMGEKLCPDCDATGKREVQVSRTLSGENDPPVEKFPGYEW